MIYRQLHVGGPAEPAPEVVSSQYSFFEFAVHEVHPNSLVKNMQGYTQENPDTLRAGALVKRYMKVSVVNR